MKSSKTFWSKWDDPKVFQKLQVLNYWPGENSLWVPENDTEVGMAGGAALPAMPLRNSDQPSVHIWASATAGKGNARVDETQALNYRDRWSRVRGRHGSEESSSWYMDASFSKVKEQEQFPFRASHYPVCCWAQGVAALQCCQQCINKSPSMEQSRFIIHWGAAAMPKSHVQKTQMGACVCTHPSM